MHPLIDPFLLLLLFALLASSAVYDLRYQRIPNLLTFPAVAIALVYHTVMSGLDGLLFSAEGLFLGLGFFLVPYLIGGMGAGDTKLMAAVGAVLGPKGVCIASLLVALTGGVYAFTILLIKPKRLAQFMINLATKFNIFVFIGRFIPSFEQDQGRTPKLCYGLAIAFGTLSYVFLGMWGFQLFS